MASSESPSCACRRSDFHQVRRATVPTTVSGNGVPGSSPLSDFGRDGNGKAESDSSLLSFTGRLTDRGGKPLIAPKKAERRRTGWWRRLGVGGCIANCGGEEASTSSSAFDETSNGRYERVKVRSYRKAKKELSAVYKGQVIQAHAGAICTMKFSPNGLHLASGGEDGVVRVWRVVPSEQADEYAIPTSDPSCVYLRLEDGCGLVPVNVENEKKGKKKTAGSACVVIPRAVFRIMEEPLHEFRGHSGDVLDLSWSNDSKSLLSSSADYTVRLWEVGCTDCIRVFLHANFVSSVQFHPTKKKRFISGSIDGKIRVWDICNGRVVDWADVRDIVTAVCYRPDGMRVVVGTIVGSCRFYDASGNRLELEAQVLLSCKNKSQRITSFQFCPSDSSKLMVTSACSKIRILDGIDVIQKYKGLRSGSCQLSATFTADGQQIISTSEDAEICIWNHGNQDDLATKQAKTTCSSERFYSSNASIALPWNGARKARNPVWFAAPIPLPQQEALHKSTICKCYSGFLQKDTLQSVVRRSTETPDLSRQLSFEPNIKCATWPEEMLPPCKTGAPLDKSQYKLLMSCCLASHSWGQVIVTAGRDGRIRSFQNYGLPAHQ